MLWVRNFLNFGIGTALADRIAVRRAPNQGAAVLIRGSLVQRRRVAKRQIQARRESE